MKLPRKISTDVLFSTAITAATRLRGIIFIPVISGTLGVAAFGAYTQILAIMTSLQLVVGLGLSAGLIRYGQESEQNITNLYYSLAIVSLGSGVVATIIIAALAPELSEFTLGDPRYTNVFRIGSLLILTQISFGMAQNYFRIDSRIKTYSTIRGINVYARLIGVLVALFVLDTALVGVMYSIVIVDTATVVLTQLIIGREIGYTVPSFDRIVEYLRYSLPYAGSSLVGSASSRIDRVLIGAFLGASAVGVYSIAYQIATTISMYRTPIRDTFFPEFSRLIEKGRREDCSEYVEQGVRYFMMIAVPTAGGMYLIGPTVVRLMTDNDAAVPSGVLFGTIAFGLVVQGIESTYGVVLMANKQTLRMTSIRAVGAVGNVLLNAVLIPSFGVFGAALATVGTYALTASIVFYTAKSVFPIDFGFLTGLRTIAATLLMVFLAEIYVGESVVVLVLAGVVIYFAAIVSLGEVSLSEIRKTVAVIR